MIHTFSIQQEVSIDVARHIAFCINNNNSEARTFIKSKKPYSELKYVPPIPGIEEVKLLHFYKWDTMHIFYVFLRIEPLTLIKGEQHIALFECTLENISLLWGRFHRAMLEIFKLDKKAINNRISELDTLYTMEIERMKESADEYDQLLYMMEHTSVVDVFNEKTPDVDINNIPNISNTDSYDAEEYAYLKSLKRLMYLSWWRARRVDYAIDVRMNNHDEVLAYMNLAKMSVQSNRYSEAQFTSIYDDHFYDYSYIFGNKTWELQIYDKEAQILSKQGSYPPEEFQRLLEESKNIARIEYRRLKNGTKTASSDLIHSRGILTFLNERMVNDFLVKCYGKCIGFEDFYREYHAKKIMAQRFPNRSREDYSARFYIYHDYMMNILKHKGMENAILAEIKAHPEQSEKTIKDRFRSRNTQIRKLLKMSPVLLPDAWKHKKHLNIPNDFLPNPIKPPTAS